MELYVKDTATFLEAKQKIRNSMKNQNCTVLMEEGTYFFGNTLTFDENDSADDGFAITYKAVGKEATVITGGTRIENWEQHTDKIYKSFIGKNLKLDVIYVNGEKAVKARWPKDTYNTVAESSKEDLSIIGFSEGDFPVINDITDLQMYIWPGGEHGFWNWFTNTIFVDKVNYEQKRINLKSPTVFFAGKGSRYYLQGSFELLTEKNEFYYDKKSGYIYYYPLKMPIDEHQVIMPHTERLFELRNAKNITFDGLEFCYTDTPSELLHVLPEVEGATHNGALYLENTKSIAVQNCKFHCLGFHGIYMTGSSHKNAVYGNLMYNIGHTGVQIEGIILSDRSISKYNRITNNHIYKTGQQVGHGGGIQLVQSENNQISHNKIHTVPRYCISIKGMPENKLVGETIDGVLVTKENMHPYSHAGGNCIEYNDASNANLDSQDNGVIETWGVYGGTIRTNRVHHSNVYLHSGFAIYLDDMSSNVLVEKNIIHDMQSIECDYFWHAILMSGVNNAIKNNIFANNRFSKGVIGTLDVPGKIRSTDNDVVCNIFYNSGNPYCYHTGDKERFRTVDNNIIYNVENNTACSLMKENWEDEFELIDFAGWQKLQENRYDQHSITCDPQLGDDFKLSPNSPAYKLGFTDIDIENIGLLPDFKFSTEGN